MKYIKNFNESNIYDENDDLHHFVNIKSKSSFDKILNDDEVLTNRVKFILNKLSNENIIKDVFHNTNHNRKFVNLYFYKDNGASDTICLLAHHDINNPKSLNANDNSASIVNLLNLIRNYNLNIGKNILIAFTDAEEIVDLKNNGAWQLSQKIKEGVFGNVKIAINLELTAYGSNIWYEHDSILNPYLKELNATKVKTPFNDSHSLRAAGISSTCIGTVEDEDIKQINKMGFCDTWGVCHRIEDNRYDYNDMKNFVDKLYDMIKKL